MEPAMTDTWKSFALPEVLRPAEDDSLLAFLRANTTSAVRIDAARLRRMDTALIELLLTAARDWRARGLGFELTQLSPLNEGVCLQLGLRSDHLIWRMAA
jgi:anti-anti-sigma regulatory factor